MNSLGEKIAHYRRKAGLTQEQLAEKCSVTAQAVSKWENGITRRLRRFENISMPVQLCRS